jgi:hypothetical protein
MGAGDVLHSSKTEPSPQLKKNTKKPLICAIIVSNYHQFYLKKKNISTLPTNRELALHEYSPSELKIRSVFVIFWLSMLFISYL